MPISTCRTIALDPRGVNRAFLCTFHPTLKLQQPQLPQTGWST